MIQAVCLHRSRKSAIPVKSSEINPIWVLDLASRFENEIMAYVGCVVALA